FFFALSSQQLPMTLHAHQGVGTKSRSQTSQYAPPKVIGTIKNESIEESSGLVASRTTFGVYWTHNDSGDGPFLYAIRTDGELVSVWRVTGAPAIECEELSSVSPPVRG